MLDKAKHILGDTQVQGQRPRLDGPLEIMRFDIGRGWQKKRGWESVGMDWRETVEKINSA